MASYWPIVVAKDTSGTTIADGTTRYMHAMGYLEVSAQLLIPDIRVYDSYTLSDLYVQVYTNTLTGNCVVDSLVNTFGGNCTVTIGGGATGVFEDAVNSDNLVATDDFCTRVVATVGGTDIVIGLVSYTLEAATDIPIIAATDPDGAIQTFGVTRYYNIVGRIDDGTVEADAQYKFLTSETLSKMRIYVSGNGHNSAGSATIRIGGADGNLTVVIGATTTGDFEDLANNDVIPVNGLVDVKVITGGVAGNLTIPTLQFRCASTVRITAQGYSTAGAGIDDGSTRWYALEGSAGLLPTWEPYTQVHARTAFTAKNGYAYVRSNTLNGACVATFRINTADATLAITIGAGLTGGFQDTVNTDAVAVGNLVNWELIAGGTAGWIYFQALGFELEQPGGPAPPTGIQDKSANMGSKLVAAGVI